MLFFVDAGLNENGIVVILCTLLAAILASIVLERRRHNSVFAGLPPIQSLVYILSVSLALVLLLMQSTLWRYTGIALAVLILLMVGLRSQLPAANQGLQLRFAAGFTSVALTIFLVGFHQHRISCKRTFATEIRSSYAGVDHMTPRVDGNGAYQITVSQNDIDVLRSTRDRSFLIIDAVATRSGLQINVDCMWLQYLDHGKWDPIFTGSSREQSECRYIFDLDQMTPSNTMVSLEARNAYCSRAFGHTDYRAIQVSVDK